MGENIFSNEGQLEAAETRGDEQQALGDATREPRAYVEQTRDYKQAEAVQATFEVVAESPASENSEKAAVDQAGRADSGSAESIAIDSPDGKEITEPGASKLTEQGKIGVDPLTGDTFGDQSSSGQDEAEGEDAVVLEPLAEKPGQDEASEAYSPVMIDEESLRDQESTGKVGKDETNAGEWLLNQGSAGKLGEDEMAVQDIIGEGRLIPDLPEARKSFIGQGTHGMLDGAGPGETHSSPLKGYGPGFQSPPVSTKVPGSDKYGSDPLGKSAHGNSSSGGGPPVHGYGPGMRGGTVSWKWMSIDENDNYHHGGGSASGSCEGAKGAAERHGDMESSKGGTGKIEIDCGNGTGYDVLWVPEKGSVTKAVNRSYTVDGGSPAPYTGSGGWGEKPQPQIVGGKDVESGHFSPMVSVGGKTVSGSGGGSEPGTEWDEGHWYGGIFASAGRPNNPDDPDYYTPNVLAPEDMAKKDSKKGAG